MKSKNMPTTIIIIKKKILMWNQNREQDCTYQMDRIYPKKFKKILKYEVVDMERNVSNILWLGFDWITISIIKDWVNTF